VLDEPVSALDVSIRAQMMNLLKDIQAQDNVAYLLVAHDLATVRHMADHTVVMYLGKIVEQAPTASLFADVRHPYTKALFAAVPEPDPSHQLDLTALMEGMASMPSAWPEPFTDTGERPLDWLHIGGGHYVRASAELFGGRVEKAA